MLVAIVLLPFGLFVASNFGAGVLDLFLNRPPTTNELLGTYVLTVPWGESTLRIDRDGTFEQRIRSEGDVRVIQGKWQLVDGDGKALFRPFGMVWDDNHTGDTAVFGITFEKARFGQTFGMIDSDLGEKYLKLN